MLHRRHQITTSGPLDEALTRRLRFLVPAARSRTLYCRPCAVGANTPPAPVLCNVAHMKSRWDDLRWLIVFNGIADRWLWSFDADGWRLRYEDPANGTLGVLPIDDGQPVTLGDAMWLADVFAYDHDAPVGVSPGMEGILPTPGRGTLPRNRERSPSIRSEMGGHLLTGRR